MMRKILPLTLILAVSLASGCQMSDYAKRVVSPDAQFGKFAESMAGTGDQMVQRKKIDACRRITTPDKVQIDVWVLKPRAAGKPGASGAAASHGTVIVLHGLGESKACFPYFGIAERLAAKGYDVVLPDLRAHGRSEGKYVTYGVKEKADLKAVMDELIAEHLATPDIYVFGVNYSGGVAIQYAAFDSRCKGVMAIEPYKDLKSIARSGTLMLGDKDFEKVMDEVSSTAHFNPAEASALDAVRSLHCPIIVAHALLGIQAPLEQSLLIYKAAPEPKKLIVPTAEQPIVAAVLEDWIAGQIDTLGQMKAATTAPAAAPASK